MHPETIKLLLHTSIPLLSAMFGYYVKNLYVQMNAVQKEVLSKINEQQVRQILADKLDPLCDDLVDLKRHLEKYLGL